MKNWQEQIKKMKNFSLLPSPPDERDYKLSTILQAPSIPTKASLRKYLTPVLDQGTSPFCVAFSIVGIMNAYYKEIGKLPKGGFSVKFVYWMCKELDGVPNQDGTYWRIALKVVQKYGCCPDYMLPWDGDASKVKITDEMLNEAKKYRIKSYAALYTYDEIKQALANGRFVGVGTFVTQDNWDDGYIIQPEGLWRGGHATYLFGFDSEFAYKNYKDFLDGRNSWGKFWGLNGNYKMAKHYVEFRDLDMNMPYFLEAWAIDFDKKLEPSFDGDDENNNEEENNKNKIVETKNFDVAPIIQNGRTLLELRSIASITNCTNIGWDEKERKVSLYYAGNKVINLWIDKKQCEIITGLGTSNFSREYKQFDVVPQIINGRTMLELRSLAMVTGCSYIDYISNDKKIVLYYPTKEIHMWINKQEYQVMTNS